MTSQPLKENDDMMDFHFSYICMKSIESGMNLRFSSSSPAEKVESFKVDGDTVFYETNAHYREKKSMSSDTIVQVAGKKKVVRIPCRLREYALFCEMMNSNGGVNVYAFGEDEQRLFTPSSSSSMTLMSELIQTLFENHNEEANKLGFGLDCRFDYSCDYKDIEEHIDESFGKDRFNSVFEPVHTNANFYSIEREKVVENTVEDSLLSLSYEFSNNQDGVTRTQSATFTRSKRANTWAPSVTITDVPSYYNIDVAADHLGQTLISLGKAMIKEQASLSCINVNDIKLDMD